MNNPRADDNMEELKEYWYQCSVCKRLIARTEFPMDEEGLAAKMAQHKCVNPNKQGFEEELRHDQTNSQ